MRRPRVWWNEPSKHPVQRGDRKFLGCRIQPLRGATCDFCATCDFWTLKRNSCIKRYPSGVCPSPARETAPGFSLRGRGWKAATPRTLHPCHLVGRGGKERERRQAAGGAHDCARQGAPWRPLLLRFVEALNTPVVGPVMGLFGGRRDSLFVSPSK